MEGISERAYTTHSGLSRGAVQEARKFGRLVLFGDGSINPKMTWNGKRGQELAAADRSGLGSARFQQAIAVPENPKGQHLP